VGLAPTGRLLRVSVYIPDLLSDRHCLVASTNADPGCYRSSEWLLPPVVWHRMASLID